MHLENHPARSWAIILQQAWTMKMRRSNTTSPGRPGNGGGDHARKTVCWSFNFGTCEYGIGCKFDHKCLICLKWGHGAHSCRRVMGSHGNQGHGGDRDGRNHRGQGRYHDQQNRGHEQNDRYHYSRVGCDANSNNSNSKDKRQTKNHIVIIV